MADSKSKMSQLGLTRLTVCYGRRVLASSEGVNESMGRGTLPSLEGMSCDVCQSVLQEGGLGENMKVHKSQLERDREKALALQAARKKAGHNPLTPYPVKVLYPCVRTPCPETLNLSLQDS